MKYMLIQFLVVMFVAVSCSKNGNIKMAYAQTQCNDKWGYGNNEQETLNKLGMFLDSLQIRYRNLTFKKLNPTAVCEACNCESGGLFILETTDHFVDRLTGLGFRKR